MKGIIIITIIIIIIIIIIIVTTIIYSCVWEGEKERKKMTRDSNEVGK